MNRLKSEMKLILLMALLVGISSYDLSGRIIMSNLLVLLIRFKEFLGGFKYFMGTIQTYKLDIK